jgi:hypothetical protein
MKWQHAIVLEENRAVQGNCEKLLLCSDNLLEQMNNYAPR